MSQSMTPFDTVVISFPDERAAQAAQEPLQAMNLPSATSIHCTTDPFQARVGSGGGSLAILMDHYHYYDQQQKTLLIVHAGGESSRSPTQMVLGKAWTSLPTCQGIVTPLQLWIQQQALFTRLPKGSVVIVASDTLVQLPKMPTTTIIDWTTVPDNAVVGVAVPAPIETASHHGVYVVDQVKTGLQPCRSVLQKPSVSALVQHNPFPCQHDNDQQPCVWIDTGVVIWLPKAVQTLLQLAQTSLAHCTRQGLAKYSNGLQQQQYALKIDLYTHLLQALRLPSSSSIDSQQRDGYVKQQSDLSNNVANAIYDALSQHELHIVSILEGHFLHLGTTQELLEFVTRQHDNQQASVAMLLANELQLVRRLECCTIRLSVDSTAVVYQSVLVGNDSKSCIGSHTLVEHSWWEGSIGIGQNCLVSGLRPTTSQATVFHLPDNMCVQQIQLEDNCFVFMVLGICDNVKSGTTVYGQPMHHFLEWSRLSEQDIWGDDNSNKILWTAKIHPCVTTESFCDVMSWLNAFVTGDDTAQDNTSLERWKRSRRLSLAEIRDAGDAAQEFKFRHQLETHIIPEKTMKHYLGFRRVLLGREHSAVDLQFVVDLYGSTGNYAEVMKVLTIFDDVIQEALFTGLYDVCGRTAMVASALLEDLAKVSSCVNGCSTDEMAEWEFSEATLRFHGSDKELRDAYSTFSVERNRALMQTPKELHRSSLAEQLSSFWGHSASLMESLSKSMTRRCVCGPEPLPSIVGKELMPVYEGWVIATAPARIDLSGGWSDTPPICCEFGAAVVGMSVLVDTKKPLSCRCRIVLGSGGILLRAESRDAKNGELTSLTESQLQNLDDLRDFGDPQSDCALLKSALVCLGIVPSHLLMEGSADFQPLVNSFCRSKESVRLEIATVSLLEHGSGLGTSSILAGCVLAAIGTCVGIDLLDDESMRHLIDAVLKVEQLLTTGGGFQDQINGLLGGVKVSTCQPSTFPLTANVERLQIDQVFQDELDQNLVLAFSGKTRLAKNILQDVLRRWAKRSIDITDTVHSLVQGARKARHAVLSSDLDALGACMSAYWNQKKIMAGEDSGAEPTFVRDTIEALERHGAIRGATLCGAGGGGYLACFTKDGVDVSHLQSILLRELGDDANQFEWHPCQLSNEGLRLHTVYDNFPIDKFELDWHRPSIEPNV